MRPGKLLVGKPRAWATAIAQGGGERRRLISLPILFYNQGALPVLVQNLRLVPVASSRESTAYDFNSVATSLTHDTPHTPATQMPVPGRQTLALVGEFLHPKNEGRLPTGRHAFELQAVLGENMNWTVLTSLELVVLPEVAIAVERGDFIALDNWK